MNRHAMKIPEIWPIVFLHNKRKKPKLSCFFSPLALYSASRPARNCLMTESLPCRNTRDRWLRCLNWLVSTTVKVESPVRI